MKDSKKAAGYVRVSSTAQIDNESLATQRKAIKKFSKSNEYQLTEIYADEGISGGTVKDRHALLQALHDAQNGSFDVLIIRDLSRFGRNARELLENYEQLEKHGIKLCSVKEGINFDSYFGKTMLTMLAAIAELEMNMIRERMLDNRISKAERGVPTSGRLPFGRTYDYDSEEWGIDAVKKQAIEWVHQEYVEKNRSLQQIALDIKPRFGFKINYQYLVTVLKEKCGNKWQIEFEELKEPITYEIPRLLPDQKIQEIKDRLAHNRTNNRADVKNKYLLTGFLRCMECSKSLHGQTQHKGKYQYYVHPHMKDETCDALGSVPLEKLENAVFSTIFENIADIPSFEQAIAQSLPDDNHIKDLKAKINKGEKRIKEMDKKLDKLVDLAMSGTLKRQTIQEREHTLSKAKQQAITDTKELKQQLSELPNVEEIKQQASDIRRELLEKYSGDKRLQEMSFEEKKQLLHFLFDGTAPNGDEYGIYVEKKGKGRSAEIDYFLFGRLTGLRTIKGDDIDYFPSEETSTYYKTNNVTVIKNEPKNHPRRGVVISSAELPLRSD